MSNIDITGSSLNIDNIKNFYINYKEVQISLSKESIEAIKHSREIIENVIDKAETVYGVTTGFGRFSETNISKNDIEKLQINLIRSHSCGMGEYLSEDIVKLAMILRVNSLAKGYSGIRLETVETLINLINNNIIPVVPCQGSLGASGDLAPLSHISLALLGEGYVWNNGEKVPTKEVLIKYDIKPVSLKGKEGLALINGTQISLAILLKAYIKAEMLLKIADVSSALSIEASKGTPDAFDEDIHKLRGHKGQINTAANIRRLLGNSRLIKTYSQGGRVQDAYSFRCVPQVHGASRDACYYIKGIIETEMNSVTDNPLVFNDKILSGGNFHAQHVGMAADNLKIALAELGSISERRIERLLNPSITDLNGFLANKPGVESGYMIAQYTAASIVSENKAISHPSTVDSISVSGNQEDHCSMAPIASRKALEIAENIEKILAIELMISIQSIELRGIDNASIVANIVRDDIRKTVPHLKEDRILFEDMENIREMISNFSLISKIEENVGKLTY